MIDDLNQSMPKKQIIRISQSVWTLFSLEVLCVLIFFGFIFNQASRGPAEYGDFTILYPTMLSLLLFAILNIIGIFIYPRKIREYKELNQRPPILLSVLRFFSILVSIIILFPITFILLKFLF